MDMALCRQLTEEKKVFKRTIYQGSIRCVYVERSAKNMEMCVRHYADKHGNTAKSTCSSALLAVAEGG